MSNQNSEPKGAKGQLITRMAERFGVDQSRLLMTLKATAFKVKNGQVSNEQMMALMVVSDQYKLNPFTKEIYAFPDKRNGIIPVVGVDGWSRMINSNSQFDGMDFNQSDQHVENDEHKNCPEWIECVMHRKDRSHPVTIREYFDETYQPPFEGEGGNGTYIVNGPWQTHTKRMLRHKAMIQCARIAFGFVGIYDEDEAERIIESDAISVYPVKYNQEQKSKYLAFLDAYETEKEDAIGYLAFYKALPQEVQIDLHNCFEPGVKSKYKKIAGELSVKGYAMVNEYIDGFCDAVEADDSFAAEQLISELSQDEFTLIKQAMAINNLDALEDLTQKNAAKE